MKVLVISFSRAGALLAKKVKELYKDQAMLVGTKEELGSEFHYAKDIKERIRLDFEKVDLIIFIGATGIGLLVVGASLIYEYWDPIKTFFVELWDNPMKKLNEFWEGLKEKMSWAKPILMELGALFGKVSKEELAAFKKEGLLLPREIIWEDGRRFPVDKVLDLRPAAAQKAGGQGDRYTIMVGGRLSFLFFERSTTLSGNNLGRWFVEKRN